MNNVQGCDDSPSRIATAGVGLHEKFSSLRTSRLATCQEIRRGIASRGDYLIAPTGVVVSWGSFSNDVQTRRRS